MRITFEMTPEEFESLLHLTGSERAMTVHLRSRILHGLPFADLGITEVEVSIDPSSSSEPKTS